MSMTAEARRRFYAEEIAAVGNLTSPSLVDALASVAREQFLPPGPWTLRSEADVHAAPRQTPDADPRHVYHNVAVAIDAGRMLFNGAPSVVASAIDRLAPRAGSHVLHVGTGLGYYTAILASCVGPSGRVLGIEADPHLAAKARANLAGLPWVEVRQGDASGVLGETFDAILINAGVTHPLAEWLEAIGPGGRMILPLTATFAPVPIGKGPLVLLTRTDEASQLAARVVGFVMIYSAVGVRDEAVNARLGQALKAMPFAAVKSFRSDFHTHDTSCWLSTPRGCFSLR